MKYIIQLLIYHTFTYIYRIFTSHKKSMDAYFLFFCPLSLYLFNSLLICLRTISAGIWQRCENHFTSCLPNFIIYDSFDLCQKIPYFIDSSFMFMSNPRFFILCHNFAEHDQCIKIRSMVSSFVQLLTGHSLVV